MLKGVAIIERLGRRAVGFKCLYTVLYTCYALYSTLSHLNSVLMFDFRDMPRLHKKRVKAQELAFSAVLTNLLLSG